MLTRNGYSSIFRYGKSDSIRNGGYPLNQRAKQNFGADPCGLGPRHGPSPKVPPA
jgi:hypothetical protein